jgi:hypothetical protein
VLPLGNTCSVIARRHAIWVSLVSSSCSAALSLKTQRASPLSEERVRLKHAEPFLLRPFPRMMMLTSGTQFLESK